MIDHDSSEMYTINYVYESQAAGGPIRAYIMVIYECHKLYLLSKALN